MTAHIPSSESKKLKLPKLFHLSFNEKLEGIWRPRINQDIKLDKYSKPPLYPEPFIDRISVSPSLKGCFIGIYPNISKYFEELKYPYMLFHMYIPSFNGNERVVLPETLTRQKLIWDAHVTKEHLILDKVQMNYWGKCKVMNTNKSPTAYTHPFNLTNLPKQSIGPENIVFKCEDFTNDSLAVFL